MSDDSAEKPPEASGSVPTKSPAPGTGKMLTVERASKRTGIPVRTLHLWMQGGLVIFAKEEGKNSKVDVGSVVNHASRSGYKGRDSDDRKIGINYTRKKLNLPLVERKKKSPPAPEPDHPRLPFPPEEPQNVHPKKPILSVTPEQRKAASAMSFGKLYGADERAANLLRSAQTLMEEAKEILDRRLKAAPKEPPILCPSCGSDETRNLGTPQEDPCDPDADPIQPMKCDGCGEVWVHTIERRKPCGQPESRSPRA